MIKLRILRAINLYCQGGHNLMTSFLIKRSVREDIRMEAEVREKMQGPRAKECWLSLNVGRGKEMDSSLELPKGMQPCGPILEFWFTEP